MSEPKMQPSYMYKAKVVRVLDGDTFDADIDLGFYVTVRHRLRVLGIDTPEVNSPDPVVREAAKIAASCTQTLLMAPDVQVLVETQKADSFGRFLAKVWFRRSPNLWASLGDELLKAGFAVSYKK